MSLFLALGRSQEGFLFQAIKHRACGRGPGEPTRERLDRADAWEMVRRRAKAAGITTEVCNHTFRGTGQILPAQCAKCANYLRHQLRNLTHIKRKMVNPLANPAIRPALQIEDAPLVATMKIAQLVALGIDLHKLDRVLETQTADCNAWHRGAYPALAEVNG